MSRWLLLVAAGAMLALMLAMAGAASAQQTCDPEFDPTCVPDDNGGGNQPAPPENNGGGNQPAPPPEEPAPAPPPEPQFIELAAGFPVDYGVAVDFSALPESVAFDGTVVVEQTASGAVVTTSGF